MTYKAFANAEAVVKVVDKLHRRDILTLANIIYINVYIDKYDHVKVTTNILEDIRQKRLHGETYNIVEKAANIFFTDSSDGINILPRF